MVVHFYPLFYQYTAVFFVVATLVLLAHCFSGQTVFSFLAELQSNDASI